jgi:hypothetical protein
MNLAQAALAKLQELTKDNRELTQHQLVQRATAQAVRDEWERAEENDGVAPRDCWNADEDHDDWWMVD